ncbi:T9SS type A sorting domain-containing protein [bacterium]|nr:T9SS type A sorting domain-containing protein [bacterium]
MRVSHFLRLLSCASTIILLQASSLHAQVRSVSFEIVSTDTIRLRAGEKFCFELVAKDSLGNIITNWDSIGSFCDIGVSGCRAGIDTSKRSWNEDPEGYSWVNIVTEVDGERIIQLTDSDFSVRSTRFVNGRVRLCFISTRAGDIIRLELRPTVPSLQQLSPPIVIYADTLARFMTEVTYAMDDGSKHVFVARPFEILCTPQDRYGNTLTDTVDVVAFARFSNELAAPPPHPFIPAAWLPSLMDASLTVHGVTAFYATLTAERERGVAAGQWIELHSAANPNISGRSDSIFILAHAPYPFEQYAPYDGIHLNLNTAPLDSVMHFAWHPSRPADPYHAAWVSRFDPSLYSDDVFYAVRFYDRITQTAGGQTEWIDPGTDSTLSITVAEFTAYLAAAQPIWSGGATEITWYAIATDTLYETPAESFTIDNARGFRVLINQQPNATASPPAAQSIWLGQNAPNPVCSITRIPFTTETAGDVNLTVTDMLGRRVALPLEAYLPAGTHTVRFDASALGPGTYIYQLRSNGYSTARRMTVLR